MLPLLSSASWVCTFTLSIDASGNYVAFHKHSSPFFHPLHLDTVYIERQEEKRWTKKERNLPVAINKTWNEHLIQWNWYTMKRNIIEKTVKYAIPNAKSFKWMVFTFCVQCRRNGRQIVSSSNEGTNMSSQFTAVIIRKLNILFDSTFVRMQSVKQSNNSHFQIHASLGISFQRD